MKRVVYVGIPDTDQPCAVPRGVPVAFGGFSGDDEVMDSWWEVMVPGADFDPEVYEWPTQWVQIVESNQPLPDGWLWLKSYVSEGMAWHLYRVPDREVKARG